MKIVEVNKYYYHRRGAEMVMFDSINGLEDAGHQIIPFAMHHPKNLKTPYDKYFISNLPTDSLKPWLLFKYFTRAFWSVEAYFKFKKLLKEEQPDLIHIHNIYTQISPSILSAAKKYKIPVVMTVHDYSLCSANYSLYDELRGESLPFRPGLHQVARSRFIKNSYLATLVLELILRAQKTLGFWNGVGKFIAVSDFVKKALIDSGFDESKITVLENPLPYIADVSGNGKKDVVAFAGALNTSKGADLILEVAKNAPDLKLKIAGSGPLIKKLEDQKNIKLLGNVSRKRVQKLFSESAVSIFPARWHEPYGLTTAEAMAAGSIPLVSGAGNLPSLVECGKFGGVVPTFKPEDWVLQIRRVLTNQDLQSEYRIRISDNFKNKKSHQNYIKRLEGVFKELKK